MATIEIASNSFTSVPFPLVLADRFFHLYEDAHGVLKVDVFRWSETSQEAVYEVRNSEPLVANIETGVTGVVVFSSDEGGFQYKFRPNPGVGQIFGKIPVEGEIDVLLRDRALKVFRGTQLIADATGNSVEGYLIGIQIGADGSFAMGVNELPKGMILATK